MFLKKQLSRPFFSTTQPTQKNKFGGVGKTLSYMSYNAGEMVQPTSSPFSCETFPNIDRILIFILACEIFICNQILPSRVYQPSVLVLNITIFLKGENKSQRAVSGWGEWLVLEVLLYQIPLSFKGAGFIDIGLTRLLWLGLLIETNTSCLTLSTFLSEKVSFFF